MDAGCDFFCIKLYIENEINLKICFVKFVYLCSVKKVGEGTIWPKISHVGLSEDIIIYPVITTQVLTT